MHRQCYALRIDYWHSIISGSTQLPIHITDTTGVTTNDSTVIHAYTNFHLHTGHMIKEKLQLSKQITMYM